MPTIGVIGNGFVGSAIVAGFLLHVDEILIYDIDKSLRTHTLEETINGADVIFVCIPTPMLAETGGRIDLTIMDAVFEAIDKLNEDKLLYKSCVKSSKFAKTVFNWSIEQKKLLQIMENIDIQ